MAHRQLPLPEPQLDRIDGFEVTHHACPGHDVEVGDTILFHDARLTRGVLVHVSQVDRRDDGTAVVEWTGIVMTGRPGRH